MVELINAVLCPSCDGTGQKPGPDDSLSICKSCNGKGMLRKDKKLINTKQSFKPKD